MAKKNEINATATAKTPATVQATEVNAEQALRTINKARKAAALVEHIRKYPNIAEMLKHRQYTFKAAALDGTETDKTVFFWATDAMSDFNRTCFKLHAEALRNLIPLCIRERADETGAARPYCKQAKQVIAAAWKCYGVKNDVTNAALTVVLQNGDKYANDATERLSSVAHAIDIAYVVSVLNKGKAPIFIGKQSVTLDALKQSADENAPTDE